MTAFVDRSGPLVELVVSEDATEAIEHRQFVHFTASEAMDIGLAMQRMAEQILRDGT